MIERAWAHYQEWEDWRAGMYRTDLPGTAFHAARLLADAERFAKIARRVVTEWATASAQHLTDHSCNRRAWLGQAACCLGVACDRLTTIEGWFTLTETEQARANAVADLVISEWERGYDRAETLFG